MAEQKDKKTKHLRSARQWLRLAEESFDKDLDVRGELNLLLARAELQHVQETSKNRGILSKYPVIRHGLAVMVAVALVSAAYGVYNQSSGDNSVRSEPAAVQPAPNAAAQQNAQQNMISLQPSVVAPPSVPVRQPSAPIVQQPSPRHQAQAEPVVIPTAEQRPPVTTEEMKHLIRAAGKSLRGE